jgi:hypothetical protein
MGCHDRLFTNARTMTDAVLLFSHRTVVGTFEVWAPYHVFRLMFARGGSPYVLTVREFLNYQTSHTSPWQAIEAVAGHRTGFPPWDWSKETVSPLADDWKRHEDRRFQIRILDEYVNRFPGHSMRDIVAYFEHRHRYYFDRYVIEGIFTDWIISGQIDALPSMRMAPPEMDHLRRIAETWFYGIGPTEPAMNLT